MGAVSTNNWIQFLKNNRIIELKSNPQTGKLVYKRNPTTNDLASFISSDVDIDEDRSWQIVNKIVVFQNKENSNYSEGSGFSDIQNEVTEKDVAAVFQYLQEEKTREAKRLVDEERTLADKEKSEDMDRDIEKIKQVIYQAMNSEQRRLFIGLIKKTSMTTGSVSIAHIMKLFDTLGVSKKSFSFIRLFSAKNTKLQSEDLKARWEEADFPIQRPDFLRFCEGLGFENSVIKHHLSVIEEVGEDAEYQFYTNTSDVAIWIIDRFDQARITALIKYAKNAPPKPIADDSENPKSSDDFSSGSYHQRPIGISDFWKTFSSATEPVEKSKHNQSSQSEPAFRPTSPQSTPVRPMERGKYRWLVELSNSSGNRTKIHVSGDSEPHAMRNAENRDASWTAHSAVRKS